MAQHLGISGAQLRQFISQVNFGISPTDREFPESIANGIVRFVAMKLGKKIKPLVAFEEQELGEDSQDEPKESKQESQLEKLAKIASKKKEEEPVNKAAAQESAKASPAAIFRKIEIDPEAAAKAKEKIETEKRKSKEEIERERLEQKAFASRKKQQQNLVKKTGVVEIPAAVSVKEFSEKIGVSVPEIIKALLKNGVIATINKTLDFETCAIVAADLEVEVKKEESVAQSEDLVAGNLEALLADEQENLQKRPPVVVVMGHVDHGKTKILDAIRNTKIVESEHGGITQHIGAMQVEKNGEKITFLDTPGHEAFTAMRARGAKTADIAILVVAADEGIRDQTVEAINHARAAGIPIVVAINKIDKENANIDKVKGELAEHDLMAEDWGGKTICVGVSALKGEGIEALLEMVLLAVEMQELKANPNRLAVGTVVEAHLDKSLGPVATILVNTGTLQVANDFAIGESTGRIKAMVDDSGQRVKSAPPSFPVQISGLETVPQAGEILQVFKNKKVLKEKVEEIKQLALKNAAGMGVGEIMQQIKRGKMKFLNIILKTDTDGSMQAVRQAIEKIEHPEVAPKIIHAAVGAINENDVNMAAASCGVVFSFHAAIPPRVKLAAEKFEVEVRDFKIIFELVDTIKKILEGLLEPEFEEIVTGQAALKQIFWSKGKVRICGCKMESGFLENGEKLRVLRDGEPVGEGKIAVLQHFEKKVHKIESPSECGIQFEGSFQVEDGDTFEGFKMEKKIKTL